MLYIKVDYSEECKRTGKRNIPGQFVIYTKNHFWEKWIPGQGYADYKIAVIDAIKKVQYKSGMMITGNG